MKPHECGYLLLGCEGIREESRKHAADHPIHESNYWAVREAIGQIEERIRALGRRSGCLPFPGSEPVYEFTCSRCGTTQREQEETRDDAIALLCRHGWGVIGNDLRCQECEKQSHLESVTRMDKACSGKGEG